MSIMPHTLTNAQYRKLRNITIAFFEESGEPKLKPYFDPVGIPTMGYGFNLKVKENLCQLLSVMGVHDNLEAICQEFADAISASVRSNHDPKSLYQLYRDIKNLSQHRSRNAAEIEAKIAEMHTFFDTKLSQLTGQASAKFELKSKSEADAVFDQFIDVREALLDRKLNLASKFPLSMERITLISLYYNSPNLIGRNLTAAIRNGDRMAAIYEIAYRSNGNAMKGIAIRRGIEALMFQSYNHGMTVTDKAAYDKLWEEFESHASRAHKIESYTNRYGNIVSEVEKRTAHLNQAFRQVWFPDAIGTDDQVETKPKGVYETMRKSCPILYLA